MIELNYRKRKLLYDQAQEIISTNMPFIFLATPDVLVGAKTNLGNFRPAILEPSALWNVEQVFFPTGGASSGRSQ